MQNNILKFYFLKLIPQATKGSLKNFLYFIILNKLKSFIILVKTQSKQIKQRKKIMPEFDKNLGCYIMLHVELHDTTNKGCLLTLTMMNSQRTDLLG
jgi:hypothetical protein